MDVTYPGDQAGAASEDAGPATAVALDGFDDIEQRDIARKTAEAVAASPPGRPLDEPGSNEVAHHSGQDRTGIR